MADETMPARARELVGIITGKRQRIDNLMSNEEVAYAALTAAHAAGHAEGVREERERCLAIVENSKRYRNQIEIAAAIQGQKP